MIQWGRGQKFEKKLLKRQAAGLPPPVLDADGLVTATGIGADTFQLVLQENCVESFSDIDELCAAFDLMSDADVTMRNMRVSPSVTVHIILTFLRMAL